MKSTFLLYAHTGREFEVTDELQTIGADVWCGRKVTFRRKGKKRFAETIEEPKFPNYIFARMDFDTYYQTRNIKYLASTFHLLHRYDENELERCKTIVQRDYEEGMRIAENGDAAARAQYTKGQELIGLSGPLSERAMTFRRMVERQHDPHPMVEVDVEMFGQKVRAYVDPLDVKEAG